MFKMVRPPLSDLGGSSLLSAGSCRKCERVRQNLYAKSRDEGAGVLLRKFTVAWI